MPLITRRHFLTGLGAVSLNTAGIGVYAGAIEPGLLLRTTHYQPTLPNWPINYPLKIAVIADIHACEPGMPASRIHQICLKANALNPDITVILGDFNAGHSFVSRAVVPEEWSEVLSDLKAPLGVYAILGNHDWWHGPLPGTAGLHGEGVRRGLARANIELLENDVKFIQHMGRSFWLAGLGDQMAYNLKNGHFKGVDDLNGTLGKITTSDPVILLAHEPMVFNKVPSRVSLTLCGHTHGGQINLPFIGAPIAQTRFGKGHIYGHVIEDDRHMIISAGLGTSIIPFRFLCPPELVLVTI